MRWFAVVVIALLPTFPPAAYATAAAPPVNDAFSAAAAIRGDRARSEAANVGATSEAGEPAHAGNMGGASVWFRWTAPRDGSFAFVTAGSDFDTVLAVYTGPALDALDQLVADDDAGPLATSELSFHAVAGTVYHVAVDGFQGKVGRVHLAWRPAPPNDNFADARTIEGRAGKTESPSVGATAEAGETRHSEFSEADRSVWFRWTAPGNMRVGFGLRNTAGTVAAYTGASLGILAPVAKGRIAILGARAGTTYQIAVERAQAHAVLHWQPSPPNDDFAEAATIVGRSGRARGSNFVSSREPGEPLHGRGARTSIWYRWRAPLTGVLRLRTTGSTYDTLLAVYRGSRLRALRPLAHDDDSGPGTTSEIRIRVQRRRVYRIAVDGFRGRMGDVALRWTLSRHGGA
jgi:hypothetical protein